MRVEPAGARLAQQEDTPPPARMRGRRVAQVERERLRADYFAKPSSLRSALVAANSSSRSFASFSPVLKSSVQ